MPRRRQQRRSPSPEAQESVVDKDESETINPESQIEQPASSVDAPEPIEIKAREPLNVLYCAGEFYILSSGE